MKFVLKKKSAVVPQFSNATNVIAAARPFISVYPIMAAGYVLTAMTGPILV